MMENLEEKINVPELLSSWGCTEETVKVFEQNDICFEVLKHLSETDIREMLPNSLGMRKLIGLKIKELRQEDEGLKLLAPLTSATTSTATTVTLLGDGRDGGPAPLNDISNVSFELLDLDLTTYLSSSQTHFPSFELNTLLQTSPMGNSVLNYYRTYNILDHTRRCRLVDIIIKHLYTYIIKNRLRPEEYNKIAAKIIDLFPKETMGTYYVPAIKKSESACGRSILAKGKLVDKVRNLIQKCDEAQPKRKRRRVSDENNSTEDDSSNGKELPLSDELNEHVLWLKVNSEPWNIVLDKWDKTYIIRVEQKEKGNVSDFLEQWPILRDLRSDVLINCDFRTLYPESELKLYSKWESFIQTIIDFKSTCIKDINVKNLIELREETNSEDGKFLIELMILPYLIPPKGRMVNKKGNKHWKFSTLETVEGILVHAKTPGDIESTIENQKSRAYSKNITVQPYVLFQGITIENPACFYVIIDNLHLQCDNAKKAFDLLFKIFHVFNASYPVQSEYIYMFIEKFVYGIDVAHAKFPPYTADLVSHLTRTMTT